MAKPLQLDVVGSQAGLQVVVEVWAALGDIGAVVGLKHWEQFRNNRPLTSPAMQTAALAVNSKFEEVSPNWAEPRTTPRALIQSLPSFRACLSGSL
eukprot:scaffold18359_cov12-Tisochrysis_lutea.AAC.1